DVFGAVTLGDVTRERRGQIVAQRDPLLVIVLEREHPLVGTILVGEKLAERVGIFECRCLHRLETIALIDGAGFFHHLPRRADRCRATIFQPARQTGLQFLRLLRFVGHGRALVSAGPPSGNPRAAAHSTFLIQLCGSLVRPYWMSTSFLRSPMATGPAAPPPISKSPLGEHTLPIGHVVG